VFEGDETAADDFSGLVGCRPVLQGFLFGRDKLHANPPNDGKLGGIKVELATSSISGLGSELSRTPENASLKNFGADSR